MSDPKHSYDRGSVEGRLLRGDPDAFGVVARWVSQVLTAPRFWSLHEEWRDLHQEVMRRLLVSLRRGHFDPARDFRAYVQSVARYAGLETTQQRRTETIGDGLDRRHGEPSADERNPALRRYLARSVMDRVSDDCREMFRLVYFEGRTYEEVGEALGVPIGTVKSRLFRCLDSAHGLIQRKRRRTPGKELA